MSKFLALIIFLFTVSCQTNESTTTGNPLISLSISGSSQSATVAMNNFIQKLFFFAAPKVQALPPPGSMTDASGNSVNLTDAWINIKEIELKPLETAEETEVDGTEVEYSGPFAVNLFDESPLHLGTATVSTSEVRRIKMKLSKIDVQPSGAPGDILNSSIYLSGTINGHSFIFKSDEEVKFEIAGPNPVSLASGSDLLLSFKIANLIKKINLGSVTSNITISANSPQSASGACPTIDASANTLYQCFRAGIEQQADLGRDDDGSGEIESSETSVK